MEKAKKQKMKLWKKLLIGVTAALLSVILILGVTVYAVWHNEIATLLSMKLVRERNDSHHDGAVYTMNVNGGFYLDKFVEQGGVKSDAELIAFITSNITKGLIPMSIESSEIACSSFTAKSEDGDSLFGRNYDFSKTNVCIVPSVCRHGRG